MVSIERIINEIDPTIICLVETHLGEEDEIEIPGYEIERNDRNKDGGGCLIAYKKQMKNLVVEIIKKETEAMWITIGNSNAEMKIGTVYFPTENQPKKCIEAVYDEMEEELMKEKEKQRTIICGDFNAKIQVEGEEKVSGSGVIMKRFVVKNNLEVANMGSKCQGKWTRVQGESRSVIDYILMKDTDDMIESVEIDEERQFSACHKEDNGSKTIYSDHNSMLIKVDWLATIRNINKDRKVKVMTEKGIERYEEALENMKISEKIDTENSLDEEYERWSKMIQEQYEKQLKSVTRRNEWKVNRLLIKQIKALKKMKRKKELTEEEDTLVQHRIGLLRDHIEGEIKMRNVSKINNLVSNIMKTGKTNMTQFWRYNRRRNQTQNVNAVIARNGDRIEEKELILEEYKNHYIELLSKKEAETEEEKETEEMVERAIQSLIMCTNDRQHRITTVEEVQVAKKELKKRKARDAHGWVNEMMISGGEEMDRSLSILFTMMDEQKKQPNMWELLKIKSIFKDNKNKVSNTRGLFITNVVSKLKEKTIKNRNQCQSSPYQCGGKKEVSTADHTLTVLETINRNRYLGCDTYLVFVDMTKCFDKIWLEDGIIEMWKSGMDTVDARMIYEMNKTAKAIIETPCGTTEEIVLNKVCKQGTVYAVQIACKAMERVNGIGETAVTCLGPGMYIMALTYVDDISGAGRVETTDKTIRNCRRLEERKKASVNMEKSKCMKMGEMEENGLTAEVKGGKLDMVDGTWIDESGDCENNIKKRRNQGEGALKKINQMTHQTKVGNQEIPLKISLFRTVYLPTLLHNMNVWGRLTADEMKDLEQAQGNVIKRLLKLPNSTSYMGVLNETGIWTVDYQLVYNRLMLYHNIINSREDRVVKNVILELQKHWVKDSWVEKIKEDAKRIGIELDEFKKLLKSRIKKKIKTMIGRKMQEKIEEIQTTKMRTVVKTGWGRKKYLDGKFSRDEVSDILKIKLHMTKYKANYKQEGKTHECRLCLKDSETTEHIFMKCHMLREVRESIGECKLESDEEEECKKMLRYKKFGDLMLEPLPKAIVLSQTF